MFVEGGVCASLCGERRRAVWGRGCGLLFVGVSNGTGFCILPNCTMLYPTPVLEYSDIYIYI